MGYLGGHRRAGNRLGRIRETNWREVRCEFPPRKDLAVHFPANDYHRSIEEKWIRTPSERAISSIYSFGHELKKFGKEICESCSHQDEGEMKLSYIASEFRKIAKRENLSQCQRACMVLCASSTLLGYDQDPGILARSSAKSSVGRGAGTCTDFAAVAENLGEKLGIDTRISSTWSHAYAMFRIEGTWYYAEPGDAFCGFFPSD